MWELELPGMFAYGLGALIWATAAYIMVCAWKKWRS